MMSGSRSNGDVILDLELRLGTSAQSEGLNSAENSLRGCPEVIVIEDDDDEDVQIKPGTSKTYPEQVLLVYQYPYFRVPAIREEDLELRLGNAASNRSHRSLNCTPNLLDGFEDLNYTKSVKLWQGSSSRCPSDFTEVKLRCAICMDSMKEETSTSCGHLFCKACITNAIKISRRCPTCREKLSQNSIHRIYLPGTTS